MEEYASIRLMLVWLAAIKLPTIILNILINSNIGCHLGSMKENTVLKIRIAKAKPAALDPTDKNATTGVGELESNDYKKYHSLIQNRA